MSKEPKDTDEQEPADDQDEEAAEERDSAPGEGEADEDEADEPEADEPPAKDEKKPQAEPEKAAASAKKKAAKPGAGAVRGRPGAKPPTPKASPTRSILLYALLIGGIALAFAYLGQQGGGGDTEIPQPTWKEGDVVDVTITLVTTDLKDLGCASDEEVKGLHCGFVDKRKPHSAGTDPQTDGKILQPYTTVDRFQFLAAGMWVSPDVKAKIDAEDWKNPSPRFNAECKFKVEGRFKEAFIRWKPENDWISNAARDQFVGSLSDCKVKQQGRLMPRVAPKGS
jgi:hypothetical protein